MEVGQIITMKKILLNVILLIAAFSCYAQQSITGKITNEAGEALVGATVQLLDAKIGNAADSEGNFQISNVAVGDYTLLVSYVGYESIKKVVAVQQNTTLSPINLVLKESPIAFDQIIIKSTRAAEKLPITYTNLKKEVIDANNLGQDVPFLLKWTPSTVVNSDAGTGIGYTGLRIRGIDPSRINVTINGIPLNDAESQGVFWVDLPDFASSTDNIQIQRGVGTSTNGPAAFGASINLNTTKVNRDAYGKVSATIGSFNTRKGNVSFGTGLIGNKFTLDGRLSTVESDGYIDRAAVDLSSYYISGAFVGRKSALRFNVFSGHEVTYQAWNGVPAQYIDNVEIDESLRTYNSAGTQRPGEPHDNEVDDYTQTHHQVFFNSQLNRNWDLNLAGNYTKGRGFFELYKGGATLTEYAIQPVVVGTETIENSDLIERRWLDNDFYFGSIATNFSSDNQKLNVNLGTAYGLYKGDHFGEVIWARFAGETEQDHRYYENDATKRDYNIFGKTSYLFSDKLTGFLDLQFRNIDYEFIGFDNNANNVTHNIDFNFFNPKFGLTLETNKSTSLYAYFGVGNKEPNRSDFIDTTPNSRPAHETVYDTEIGIKKQWKKAAIEANLYYMDYNNQLVLTGQINDVGEYSRTNIKNSYRAGLEVVGGVQLTNQLNLEGSLTLSNNKIKSFTEYIDNWDTWGQETVEHGKTDLAFSPKTVFNIGLNYDALTRLKNQNLSFGLATKFVGEQYIDNTSNQNTVLPAYNYTDLRLSYRLKTSFVNEIGITLLVRDLFDVKYISSAWTYRYISAGYDGRADDPTTRLEQGNTYNLTGYYPQAGRNYLLGLSLSF